MIFGMISLGKIFIADYSKYAKSTKMFHRARRKRSYRSSERRVETLVVVDQDMYKKHGRENITTYVLSIFNIVSNIVFKSMNSNSLCHFICA